MFKILHFFLTKNKNAFAMQNAKNIQQIATQNAKRICNCKMHLQLLLTQRPVIPYPFAGIGRFGADFILERYSHGASKVPQIDRIPSFSTNSPEWINAGFGQYARGVCFPSKVPRIFHSIAFSPTSLHRLKPRLSSIGEGCPLFLQVFRSCTALPLLCFVLGLHSLFWTLSYLLPIIDHSIPSSSTSLNESNSVLSSAWDQASF